MQYYPKSRKYFKWFSGRMFGIARTKHNANGNVLKIIENTKKQLLPIKKTTYITWRRLGIQRSKHRDYDNKGEDNTPDNVIVNNLDNYNINRYQKDIVEILRNVKITRGKSRVTNFTSLCKWIDEQNRKL